jgi:hypothetical protein
MHAYEHGIVICCGDGITHWVFLHFFHILLIIQRSKFFSHLTCYWNWHHIRILLAGIKFLGECLCPRCLIKKANVSEMGTEGNMNDCITLRHVDDQAHHNKIDRACKLIFQHGVPVDGKQVKSVLNSESLVPTHVSCWYCIQISTNKLQNAFSDWLFIFGFNFFSMLVVDMLHKFELGVWKAIFTHLMCIIHAARGAAVQELNWRYVFDLLANISHTQCSATDTIMCQCLGEAQSDVSTRMLLQWSTLQPEILKICCRWVLDHFT